MILLHKTTPLRIVDSLLLTLDVLIFLYCLFVVLKTATLLKEMDDSPKWMFGLSIFIAVAVLACRVISSYLTAEVFKDRRLYETKDCLTVLSYVLRGICTFLSFPTAIINPIYWPIFALFSAYSVFLICHAVITKVEKVKSKQREEDTRYDENYEMPLHNKKDTSNPENDEVASGEMDYLPSHINYV